MATSSAAFKTVWRRLTNTSRPLLPFFSVMLAISERQLQLLDEAPFLTEQWYVDPVATKRQLANKRREILELNREKQLLELLAGD